MRRILARGFSTARPGNKMPRENSFGYPGESSARRGSQSPKRILVTGSSGQIGQELVPYLRDYYGAHNVIASDVRPPTRVKNGGGGDYRLAGDFVYCDVVDADNLARVVLEHSIDTIVHLASLLSAVGEQNPQLAIRVNSRGIENVLEVARNQGVSVFAPSTIAVFGPSTQRINTPDDTIMRPTTIYGTTKVYLELLGDYYHAKYGVDFRSMRYPGIISSKTMPGGGTTDYAVEIFYEAVKKKRYTSFLAADSSLPMMYMPDCLRATRKLIEAPSTTLKRRTYNITSMSFTPKELAASISKFIPEFQIEYKPDFRQKIADTWPSSLDDNEAREDWGWAPKYDIDQMSKEMLEAIGTKLKKGEI